MTSSILPTISINMKVLALVKNQANSFAGQACIRLTFSTSPSFTQHFFSFLDISVYSVSEKTENECACTYTDILHCISGT